jgi:hypothetical protein
VRHTILIGKKTEIIDSLNVYNVIRVLKSLSAPRS